jgi:hypothetical protein
MRRNDRQSEAKHLKRQSPKAPLMPRANFRHRDRGMRMGRVGAV